MIVTPSLIEGFEFNGNANGVRGTLGAVSGATLIGTPQGQGYSFNGLSKIFYSISIFDLVNNFTIIVRFKTSSVVQEALIGKGIAGADNYFIDIRNGVLLFGFYNASGGHGFFGGTVNDNEYHECAVTYDKYSIKIFDNGILKSNGKFNEDLVTNIQPLAIGARNNIEYFNGIIDRFMLYNKALSDTDIKRIYEGFSPLNG